MFVTIDTTGVDPIASGSYGGGIQTDIIFDPATFSVGDFSSSDPADYNVVFDVAANGFAPNNVDIFLNIRNSTNDNVLGSQLNINQNSPAFAPFVTQLGATDGTVPVVLSLADFDGLPADVSGLANADRFQFQFFTRSLDENYSDDAGNVLVLDNVGITFTPTAVPEPTSTTLLVAGAIGLISRRRRSA